MKKNIVSIILAGIAIIEFMFLLQYKARADQATTEATEQYNLKEEARVEAIELRSEAQRQMIISEIMRVRGDSLQQQLDKCK